MYLKSNSALMSVASASSSDLDWAPVFTTDGLSSTYNSYSTICKYFPDLTTDSTIRVTMGQVKDYFRPKNKMTMCTFLTKETTDPNQGSYKWSQTLNGTFAALNPFTSPGYLGGSNGIPKPDWFDGRGKVAFWGHVNQKGGCCHLKNNYKDYGNGLDSGAWGRAFSIDLYIGNRMHDCTRPLAEFVNDVGKDLVAKDNAIEELKKAIEELKKEMSASSYAADMKKVAATFSSLGG
jgi:hypothetical protein